MNSLLATMIHEMARRTGTRLTDRHYDILEYASKYYEKNRVGPLFPNIKRNVGVTKSEIETLFPHGLKSVYAWIGIPIVTPDSSCKPIASVQVDDFREVYLDHNATTYVRDEVRDLLIDHFQNPRAFGNASSSTTLGRMAYALIDDAREEIAGCLQALPREIVFCGCGSEANNHAIKGLAMKYLDKPGHVITSKTEHSAVLETTRSLEAIGFRVTYLDPLPDGRITPESVREALCEDSILVAIMAVNNEIGVINPIEEIGMVCRDAGVPFFVDAIQGFGKITLAPKASGISMLSISGHKIYAPKGVAALFVDDSLELAQLIHGGGQENEKRAGTENVAAIASLGRAATLGLTEKDREGARLTALRDDFLDRLAATVPGCKVNGALERRVPHNLSIAFPGIDSGALLLSLNQIGVYVSAGSACHAGAVESSHVLEAIGTDTDHYGTVRFSFGLRSTTEDLDYLFRYLPEIIEKLREDDATPDRKLELATAV